MGPYTELGLKRHLENDHYICSVARVAVQLTVQVARLKEIIREDPKYKVKEDGKP